MHLKFFNLRQEKAHIQNIPSQSQSGAPFRFDFDLDDLYVDMAGGSIIVSEKTVDLPQNVALGFAIPLLFSICQPRTLKYSPSETKPREPELCFQRRSAVHRQLLTDDLILLDYIGYHYIPAYPVYWETYDENAPYMFSDSPLVWDMNACSGDFGNDLDSSGSHGFGEDEEAGDPGGCGGPSGCACGM